MQLSAVLVMTKSCYYFDIVKLATTALILIKAPALMNFPCLFSKNSILLTCMNFEFLFASLGQYSSLKWDLLLKERICSWRSKFFPLRVAP